MAKRNAPRKRIPQCRHGYKNCGMKGIHDRDGHEVYEVGRYIWCNKHGDYCEHNKPKFAIKA